MPMWEETLTEKKKALAETTAATKAGGGREKCRHRRRRARAGDFVPEYEIREIEEAGLREGEDEELENGSTAGFPTDRRL